MEYLSVDGITIDSNVQDRNIYDDLIIPEYKEYIYYPVRPEKINASVKYNGKEIAVGEITPVIVRDGQVNLYHLAIPLALEYDNPFIDQENEFFINDNLDLSYPAIKWSKDLREEARRRGLLFHEIEPLPEEVYDIDPDFYNKNIIKTLRVPVTKHSGVCIQIRDIIQDADSEWKVSVSCTNPRDWAVAMIRFYNDQAVQEYPDIKKYINCNINELKIILFDYVRCSGCGQRVPPGTTRDVLGRGKVCWECIKNYPGTYFTCKGCSRYFTKEHIRPDVNVPDELSKYCQDCLENYPLCPVCKTYIANKKTYEQGICENCRDELLGEICTRCRNKRYPHFKTNVGNISITLCKYCYNIAKQGLMDSHFYNVDKDYI